jgi:hypothetical protein
LTVCGALPRPFPQERGSLCHRGNAAGITEPRKLNQIDATFARLDFRNPTVGNVQQRCEPTLRQTRVCPDAGQPGSEARVFP